MADLKLVKSDEENHAYYYSSPVRENNFKIYWPQYRNGEMWRIAFEGGGETPAELSGRYTSLSLAKQAIEQWSLTTKPTPGARFKGKKPPVLATKKRVTKRGKSIRNN